MESSKLLEFISSLKGCSALTFYDQGFLERLDALALTINSTTILSGEQLQSLKQIFSERFKKTIDTPNDYTYKTIGENLIWIKFSQILAAALGTTYLKILMPSVVNITDPNTYLDLASTYNLNDLYLGEDNTTLFSTQGLLKQIQKGDGCVTNIYYKDTRKYFTRALSLLELFRIQSKTYSKVFTVGEGESYSSFKAYLDLKVFPQINKELELPRYILNLLLNLSESYFTDCHKADAKQIFKTKTLQFAMQLKGCHFDEVNCFYGQEIKVGSKTLLLSNILLDCMHYDTSSLPDKLLGLVRWIALTDSSLISEMRQFDIIYRDTKLGRYFALDDLKSILLLLSADSRGLIKDALLSVIDKLRDKTEIDGEVLSFLQDIYILRWQQVIRTDEDYTRLQGGVSGRWIKLAQILSGYRLITENYYRFLMPTLTEDIDPVQKSPVSDYPLSHYILSSDGEKLIYLENSLQQFIRTGIFYNCNTIPPVPYDDAEIELMKFANPRYHKYMKFAHGGLESDPLISRSTVLAIYELVNKSFFPDFLHRLNISDEEVSAAVMAYESFGAFLDGMDEEERQKLFAQRIIFRDITVNFLYQLQRVEEGQCSAKVGLYFAKLVMDYYPNLRFRDDIETKLETTINEMRVNSAKKVFSDITIDDAEAKRRILVLAADLMSHPGGFDFALFGKVVKIWDCSNTMVASSKQIFDMIMPLICSSDFKYARHNYAMILEVIVNPALKELETSLFARAMTYSDTRLWLSSISDSTLFEKDTSWFDPKLLFLNLTVFSRMNSEISPLLSDFLFDFMHTYAQPQTDILKEIRVNIKFKQFLSLLKEPIRRVLLSYLLSSDTTNDQSISEICAIYLIRRIANICTSSVSTSERSKIFVKIQGLTKDYGDETSTFQMMVTNINMHRAAIEVIASNSLAKENLRELLDNLMSPIHPLPPRLEREVALIADTVPAVDLLSTHISTKSVGRSDASVFSRSSTPIRGSTSGANSTLDQSPLRSSGDSTRATSNQASVAGITLTFRSNPKPTANLLSIGIAGVSPKSADLTASRTPPILSMGTASTAALPPLPHSKARTSLTTSSVGGVTVAASRQASSSAGVVARVVAPQSIFSSIKLSREVKHPTSEKDSLVAKTPL